MDVGLDLSSESLTLTGVGKLLLKGSLDLLIHIQLFLDPVDILALRHVNTFGTRLDRGLCG